MTWFRVDDTFHSHPKVLATEPAALGLWVVAGTWSSANLTDGFVPDYVLPRLLPGAAKLAEELATSRLWKRVRGGYQFHDWTDYNPTAESVKTEREAARERMRKVRADRKIGSKTPAQPENGSPEQPANVREMFGRSSATPTRPDPTLRGGSSLRVTTDRARASPEPPRRCEAHTNHPKPPPCGPCADARHRHDKWLLEQVDRQRDAPRCERHRGQLAETCSVCRSEELAPT